MRKMAANTRGLIGPILLLGCACIAATHSGCSVSSSGAAKSIVGGLAKKLDWKEPRRTAVLDFDASPETVEKRVVVDFRQELEFALIQDRVHFSVVTGRPEALDELERFLRTQMRDTIDEKTAPTAGRILGVEYLLIGALDKSSCHFRVIGKLLHAERGEVVASARAVVVTPTVFALAVLALIMVIGLGVGQFFRLGIARRALRATLLARRLEIATIGVGFLGFLGVGIWEWSKYWEDIRLEREIGHRVKKITTEPQQSSQDQAEAKKRAEPHYNKALEWHSKGDYARAIVELNQAIEAHSTFGEAYLLRAQAWEERGEYEFAFEDYSRVVEIDPKNATAYLKRSDLRYSKEQYDGAIEDLTRVLQINPGEAGVYWLRGMAWAGKGEYDRAIEDYGNAIRRDPQDATAYQLRGKALLAQQRHEAAWKDFRKACENGNQESCGDVVVPEGEFWMGCNESVDTECSDDEKPYHKVYLDAFTIDKTEVTVGAYEKCVNGGRCSSPETGHEQCNWGRSDRGNHPINCVDWTQAKSYCSWAGKRLPTEAEWEKAARGTDGGKYPWGNAMASCHYAVMNDGGNGCGEDRTWPVGSKPTGASHYGALDMVGNVGEWVNDWYEEKYYASSPSQNPKGPSSGEYRVIRGGSRNGYARIVRTSYRSNDGPTSRFSVVGFRCARMGS